MPKRMWIAGGASLASLITACCIFSTSAIADVSLAAIGMGHGAPSAEMFKQFQATASRYNASGERFRIDTHCPSACTMFLRVRKVCIAPGASLAFHAGGNPRRGVDPYYTGQMLNAYKPALRKYLTSNGYMDRFDFHTISGDEMIRRFGYPACP
ncbi:hypothetical protein RPMA_08370 [Tardiphaga alba]|uniref:Uncharacterized protein n=1 Tax=Tardiphaga alba TaxID=340268 RepID=A0ABX8A559_9BRAD|nr:hypothetical protein [Tardiphaga alba]QUS38843.1 hypothetical protein RPMA_08370 [Tardiphaga alba]